MTQPTPSSQEPPNGSAHGAAATPRYGDPSVSRESQRATAHLSGMERLFMVWFLAALGVLFAASAVLYVVTWTQQTQWPPAGSPELPLTTLIVGTVLIVVSSVTMGRAVSHARHGNQAALSRALVATFVLGLGFLALQTYNWAELAAAHHGREATLFSFLFYALTAVHAVHVVGGLIPLLVVWAKSRRGHYSPARHNGVRMMGWYWHFLDVVWVVLFGMIAISYMG